MCQYISRRPEVSMQFYRETAQKKGFVELHLAFCVHSGRCITAILSATVLQHTNVKFLLPKVSGMTTNLIELHSKILFSFAQEIDSHCSCFL